MKCYKHKDKDAIGTCSSCSKGICDYCSVDVKGKLFCRKCAAEDGKDEKAPEKIAEKTPEKSNGNASVGRRSPGLAALLSFIFMGAGQIYNGQIMKFIMIWIASLLIMGVSFVLMFLLVGFLTIFLIVPVWLYSIYDAYATAKDINRKLGVD